MVYMSMGLAHPCQQRLFPVVAFLLLCRWLAENTLLTGEEAGLKFYLPCCQCRPVQQL